MKGTLAMPNSASPAASLSDPGPPYFRSSRYATATIHPIRLAVSRTSHCHQTPHAFLAHSGPVTSVMIPNSTTSSAAAQASRSWRGLPPKEKPHAGDATDDRRDEEDQRRRQVDVENLLHQPHRRFVRRVGDQERRDREHQAADDCDGHKPLGHIVLSPAKAGPYDLRMVTTQRPAFRRLVNPSSTVRTSRAPASRRRRRSSRATPARTG